MIVTSKCLPSTLKCKAGVFKFLQFEDLERFQKLRFGEGLAWTEGLTVKIQFRFHISPPYIYIYIYIYIVCTGPPTNFKVLFQYKKFQ